MLQKIGSIDKATSDYENVDYSGRMSRKIVSIDGSNRASQKKLILNG